MAGTPEYELLNKNLEIVDGHAVKAPEDYQDPEQLYQALIARVRKYHPSADITLIEKAYRTAKSAHKDQARKVRRTVYYTSSLGGHYTRRSGDG